ncbi:MAG: rhomboid family intramembrane serine protease [Candidatus Lernaella stagnicola]|nr:rhomboid family intramembrane serine protease [Candidatus Lernaella stagnicola]
MTFDPGGYGHGGYGRPQTPQIRFGGPITPVLKYFMIACAGVFVLQFLWRGWGMTPTLEELFGLYTPYFWRGAFFQIVTYSFLHGSPLHLGFNLLVLWMFAGELEVLWGRKRFAAYMIITAVGAALCQLLFTPLLPVPVIGASGIVYGMLLAFGITFPNRIVLLFFVIPMRVKWLVIGLGVMEFMMAFNPGSQTNIAHLAHLGGMLFGYLFLRWDKVILRMRDRYYRRKLEKRRKKNSHIFVVKDDEDEPPYVH